MDIEYLREFIDLSQIRNLTKAASRIGVSRTALSKHIAAVEQEFGIPLFVRDSTGVELTPAGKSLLASSQLLVGSWDQMHDDMDEFRKLPALHLRIGLFTGHKPTDDLVQTTLSNLQRRHLAVDAEVIEITEPCMQALREGKYDLISPVHADDEDMSGLEERLFLEEPLAAITPTDNPLATKALLSPNDLTGTAVLTVRSPAFRHYTHYIESLLERKGISPQYVSIPYTSFNDLSRNLAALRGGIYLIHASVARYTMPLTTTSFRALRFDDEEMQLPIYLTWRKDDPNPALKYFVNEFMRLSQSIDLSMYWQ